MDGQYWKGDRTMSTNEWLLTSDFWQFLEPWHGRWYEYEIFIAWCTDNIYDLENERWLLGDMIDHVGIYGSKVAEGLSAFNVGLVHDDVIKWKLFLCYWPFVWGIHWSPVNSPHKSQWGGALMFSLICAWINSWVNNREAGDLRCHCAHYDVIVMCTTFKWYITW